MQIRCLNSVDKELDMATDSSLLVDYSESNPRKEAVEIGHQLLERFPVRANDGRIAGIAAQWIGNEHLHHFSRTHRAARAMSSLKRHSIQSDREARGIGCSSGANAR